MNIARICLVIFGLFHIGFVVEDGLEAGGSVDQDTIGSNAESWAY